MKYLNHLNYNDYNELIFIQIQGVQNKAIIPTPELEFIFKDRYNLKRNESFDVCQAVEESCVEYVLDGSKIEYTPHEIKQDINDLIVNYNTPPDYFSDERKKEYHKHDVKLCEFNVF